MTVRKFFIRNLMLLIALFILSLTITFNSAAAQEDVSGRRQNEWKQLVATDYVYDIAVSGGHLWQGINGGAILRSLSASQVYRHYHKLNSGLRGNHVYAAAPDKKGGVWLGTEKGIVYYNAQGDWSCYNTENSPLTVNDVQAIHLDDKGGVWFGTWRGGAYYLGADKKWQTYNTENSSLPGNRIYAITTDREGGTWFGVDSCGAAYLSAEGEWSVVNASNSDLPVNDVPDIVVDSEGSVWFATYNGLACLESSGEWKIYSTENSILPADLISVLALSEEGSIWAGAGGGVARIVGGEVKTVYTKENSKLPGDVVKSLCLDESGRVWTGTWGGGVACLTPSEDTWTVYNYRTTQMPGKLALPSNTINTVLPLHLEGNDMVWFGTDKGAASFDLQGGTWTNFPLVEQSGGEPAHVRRISRGPDGSLAFALDGSGLAVLNTAGSWKYYRESNSALPSDAVIDAVFDDAGGIWIATMGSGAAYFSASGQWTLYNTENSAIPSDYLNCVLPAGGKVWFGTWGDGASVYDSREESWQVYNTSNSKLPLDDIRCLLTDFDGGVWFGTWGGGLARLDTLGNWSLSNENSGLPANIIRSLAIDPAGRIWAATPAGAAYYNNGVWKALDSAETGLQSENLWQVACDQAGNVWFSTYESGVAVYNPQGLTSAVQGINDLAQKPGEIILYVNKKILRPDVPPLMQEARVRVPLRIISESLGAQVNWERGTGKIEVELDEKKLELTVGSKVVKVDGVQKELDVLPLLVDGRILVPLRFVGENLGLTVQWDGAARTVVAN